MDRLSFSVADNECIAVLGPNGAGKSTLLLHLNGLLPERLSGEPSIWVGDTPLTSATLETIRQRVGLLFQDPDDQIISATVFEDVAFGPRQLGVEGGTLRALVEHCLGLVCCAGLKSASRIG